MKINGRQHVGTMLVPLITAAVTVGVMSTIPGNAASPSEGATSLTATAQPHVLAGIHTTRHNRRSEPKIDKWFNSENGVKPTISGGRGYYRIDFGFRVVDDYAQCTIDSNWVDTRDAMCSIYLQGKQTFSLDIWDTGTLDGRAHGRNAEFWILVYGP